MYPAVPVPENSGVKTPVDFKLKPGWRYDPSRRVFVSDSGKEFAPKGDLPKKSKIVPKIASLAAADRSKLSEAERDLQLYAQVILPEGESAADYVETVRSWPCVDEASLPPEISLPNQFG